MKPSEILDEELKIYFQDFKSLYNIYIITKTEKKTYHNISL